jgi:hypothetical protein
MRSILDCVFLLILIAVGEILLHSFHLPAWPVFMCMVSFFIVEQNPHDLPKIVVGGVFGLLCVYVVEIAAGAIAPSIGAFNASLVCVLVFVGLIVLLKEAIPLVFNSFAFLFLLIGRITPAASELVDTQLVPALWAAEIAIGGTLIIYGCIGIRKLALLCLR